MMYGIKKRAAALVVFVGALIFAMHGETAAQMLFSFSPARGVWDTTGNYPSNEFDATNSIDLVQDDKGKITGVGTGFASDSGIDVNLVYDFAGSIKGGSSQTRVSLKMRVSGSATDGVVTLPVSGNIKMSLDLDKTNNVLLGSGNGKLCVQRQCGRVEGPVQFELPQPMDGSWTLDVNLQNLDGKRIGGTANATLSNGRAMPFTVTGNVGNAGVRFNLKGSAGTILFGPASQENLWGAEFIKAKLLGQSVEP